MDEQNWKAQMDAVHDVLDTKARVSSVCNGCSPESNKRNKSKVDHGIVDSAN